MLSHLVARARVQVEQTAQTAAIGLFACVALTVGLVFWTLAGWLFLLTVTTPLNAAVILGAVYTGVGLIGLASVSMRRKKPVPQPAPVAPAPEATFEGLMAAFMSGMNAGARTRS